MFPGDSMRCSKCGSENPDGKRFCSDCGSALGNRCSRCGSENPAGKKFCGECGAALTQPADAPSATQLTTATITAEKGEPYEASDGERRYLTVLFSDLVDSTKIAAHLDAEEWREIAAEYQRVATDAINRFGGYVAQYLGDGVMAYFGYPQAHDNDAERAARSGLAILDAVSALTRRLEHGGGSRLAVRVGIHTGAVVVGAGDSKRADVFGEAPNIAARVQTAADPGTLVVTADTHRLISGMFVVENRGEHQLKGIERAIQLYRVIQPSGVRSRLEAAAASRGLTPFVGREEELHLLASAGSEPSTAKAKWR